MPKRTIKGELYDKRNGATKKLSDVTTVTYPDIELLTETLKGSGINGEINLPTIGQIGALEIEVGHNGLSLDIIRTFAMETQHFEHRWASQVLNRATGASEVLGKKMIFKGLPKKLGLGSIESNKAEETSTTFECLYLKYVIGNTVALEIDKLNDVFIIDGVDYSAVVRNVL